uniref:Uncharacterized protein n=1 Tax=Sphaerodactylus townsendi TaxID=933632 RepID=A0ACB8F6D1_9SAUR
MKRGSEQTAAAAPSPGPWVTLSGFRSRSLGDIGSAEAPAVAAAHVPGDQAGLNLGFVVTGVVIYLSWKTRQLGKEQSLRRARLLLSNEEEAGGSCNEGEAQG